MTDVISEQKDVFSQPIEAISVQSDLISELNIFITKNALSKLIGEAHFFIIINSQQYYIPSSTFHTKALIPISLDVASNARKLARIGFTFSSSTIDIMAEFCDGQA